MPEPTGTFRPLDQADRPLHGPPALLLCGHTVAELAHVRRARADAGLDAVPVLFVPARDAERTLGDLVASASQTPGQGEPSLPTRAVVVAGITQAALHALMQAYRASGLAPALWAALTPVNEAWTLGALLRELAREREALGEAMRRAAAGATDPRP